MAQTLVDMFLDRASKYGARTALLVKREGRWHEISWDSFASRVRDFALGLAGLGVGRGAAVSLLSENRPEWAFADLAILSLGAVNVPIYPTSSVKDIEYIARHCEAPVLILSTADQWAKVRTMDAQGSRLKKWIVMDPVAGAEERVLTFEGVCELGRAAAARDPGLYERLRREGKPEDVASFIYTSGTTGEPKGVMLTHRNFLSNVEASVTTLQVTSDDRSLSFLPLSHVFERMAGHYFLLHQGCQIAYAENMNTVAENLCEVRPTVVIGVPRFFEKLHARVLENVSKTGSLAQKIFSWALSVGRDTAPFRREGKPLPLKLALAYGLADRLVFAKIRKNLGGRLRFFISGGAPLAKEIADFFFSAGVLILEGYGLTETSPVVTVNRADRFRFGSVGPVIPGVDVRIAEDGEILIQGPCVMLGYYKNPQATAEAIRDGWFHTGDIGRMDGEGYLYITDRKKDLIITSGGKNVAPQKIENLLATDELIAQACVIGDRRNYLTALIVPRFGAIEKLAQRLGLPPASRADLARHERIRQSVRDHIESRSADLAKYEKIKEFTLLPEEFTQEAGELTPTLKLKRKVIHTKYRTLIDAMYQAGDSR
jgi:long-chain acyl-CoA synthetase